MTPPLGIASAQRGNTIRDGRATGVTTGKAAGVTSAVAAELERRTREQGEENALLKIHNDALKKMD